MKEIIVRMTTDHIKVKNGEYVQDLVRCKDCKKIETVKDKEGTCYYWCLIHGHATDEWRFCDYGERAEPKGECNE